MERSQVPNRTGIPAGISIAGEIYAEEDLYIDGHVEGPITAPGNHVAVGSGGVLKSKIIARGITVAGTLDGSLLAAERVRILNGATVRGHVTSPALLLMDGARFNGTVDPERTEAAMRVARYREKQGGQPGATTAAVEQ